ncbi:MAG: hypothetical protein ABF719_11630 [Acetobacter sp.]|uniref:hypothetical protein n=1 Tax=Acetobacter sp. TaxID=440 RepID=UPI0039E7D84C
MTLEYILVQKDDLIAPGCKALRGEVEGKLLRREYTLEKVDGNIYIVCTTSEYNIIRMKLDYH